MQILAISDIGVKRKENQDNFWSAILDVDGIETGIVCLCDGMGGLQNGGTASKIVVQSIKDSVLEGVQFSELFNSLENSNNKIYNLSQREGNMGTTCTLVECSNGVYSIYHIGDSRCYLIHEGKFSLLTTDHSALKQLGLTKQENPALYKKYKNSLTKCIGVKPEIEVDYLTGKYSDGDSILVCSDGLWHYIEDVGLSVKELENLSEVVNKCIGYGEKDNITGCVIYL